MLRKAASDPVLGVLSLQGPEHDESYFDGSRRVLFFFALQRRPGTSNSHCGTYIERCNGAVVAHIKCVGREIIVCTTWVTGGVRQVRACDLRFFDFSLMTSFSTAFIDALHDEIWVSGRSILLVTACGVIVDQD